MVEKPGIVDSLRKILHCPRDLLLVDLVGATITSLSTILLLASELVPTGLPAWLLYSLAIVAASYAIFDMFSWLFGRSPATSLAIIALLNVAYCLVAFVCCLVHFRDLTDLGTLYFGVEIPIVLGISWWELRVARRALFRDRQGEAAPSQKQ